MFKKMNDWMENCARKHHIHKHIKQKFLNWKKKALKL